MKLNDILMAIDQETLIRVAITMYGMKFTTDHYGEYFLDQHEADELLDRRVIREFCSIFQEHMYWELQLHRTGVT